MSRKTILFAIPLFLAFAGCLAGCTLRTGHHHRRHVRNVYVQPHSVIMLQERDHHSRRHVQPRRHGQRQHAQRGQHGQRRGHSKGN